MQKGSRASLLGAEQKLSAFPWSSFPEYLKNPGRRQPWLRVERLLGEHGIANDSAAGRRNLKSGWNCGGRSKMDNRSRDCCGVGALGARSSAKSCWRE